MAIDENRIVRAYEERGCAFPIDVFSEARALDYGQRFVDYWSCFDVDLRHGPREEQWFVYEQTHLLLPWVFEMVSDPNVLDAIEEIIGPDIVVWISQWFVKMPGERGIANGLVDWHQDEAYWGFDPPTVATAWIACSPVTAENGPMRVIAGSHRGPLLEYEEGVTAGGNVLSRGQRIAGVDPDLAIDICLRPGQMSIHHPRAVHGSSPNRSGIPRINLVARYASPAIHQQGPNPPEGVLLRGTDHPRRWRLRDAPTSTKDSSGQLDSIRRIKENTRFVAARSRGRDGGQTD